MQIEHSTRVRAKSSLPLTVPEALTGWIDSILNGGKRRSSGDSFTLPADPGDVRRCEFCGASIVPARLANGVEYDAAVFGTGMELRVDLFSVHSCPEAARYEEFLNSPELDDFREEEAEEDAR